MGLCATNRPPLLIAHKSGCVLDVAMSFRLRVWLSRRTMKSAYELAMERLSKSAPAKTLSADQKARIADLESLHRSKVAQREIALADELAAARVAGHPEKADALRAEFAAEKQRLEEDLEAKKQRVRDGK